MYLYCTKCGTQNSGDEKVCSSCGQPLSVLPDVPPPFAKTSRLAIWSLILGILTLLGGFFTAIPAVICGIVGLVGINKSNGRLKGTGLAIAGIVIPVIIMAMLMLTLSKTRQLAQQIMCSTNLSGIDKALLTYASDDKYESYPTADKWCDLLIKKCNVSPEMFCCPGSDVKHGKSSYAFNINAAGKKTSEIPLDMVLIFETAEGGWNMVGGRELVSIKNHRGDGCNVLFADQHVKYVKTKDLSKLRWKAD
jgi:hypothetical protein